MGFARNFYGYLYIRVLFLKPFYFDMWAYELRCSQDATNYRPQMRTCMLRAMDGLWDGAKNEASYRCINIIPVWCQLRIPDTHGYPAR